VAGVAEVCPPGTYGAVAGLASPECSGACVAGYFCPANSTSATQAPCGGVSAYCPAGSGRAREAAPGEYTLGPTVTTRNSSLPCPSGSYCAGGVRSLCEAGSFGCADRLSVPTCNGPCTAGYYCPAGSTSSQAEPCGGGPGQPDAAAYYCPPGAPLPSRVGDGNYSTGSPDFAPHVRTGQAVCPAGRFCVGGVVVRGCAVLPCCRGAAVGSSVPR
jgi:hypothetical protein